MDIAARAAAMMRAALETARAVGRDYAHKRVSVVAAALAFYLFLALFPFLLVTIAAVGYAFGSSQQGLELLHRALRAALPGSGRAVEEQIEAVVAQRALVGGLGLAMLAWSASNVFATLARGLGIVWQVEHEPRFLGARLRGLGLLVLAMALLLLSVLVTSAVSVITHLRAAGVLVRLGEMIDPWRLASAALSLGVGFAVFFALYRLVPAARIGRRDAALGALFAAVAWECAKRGFAWYLERFANFDRIYGPLGAIVALLLWIYVSVVITLVGAELAWVRALRERGELQPIGGKQRR